MYTHPEIEEVQVIGVPDKVYGEQLMAWIKRKPDLASPQLVSQDDLKAFCAGKIAHYKVPHYVQFVMDGLLQYSTMKFLQSVFEVACSRQLLGQLMVGIYVAIEQRHVLPASDPTFHVMAGDLNEQVFCYCSALVAHSLKFKASILILIWWIMSPFYGIDVVGVLGLVELQSEQTGLFIGHLVILL